MKYRTLLFDFDGTLADTEEISLAVLNSLADEFGFEPTTPEEIPYLKQSSARELLTKRMGIPLWNVRLIRRLERRIREERLKRCVNLQVFAGIPELFDSLHREGYRLGVVSSSSPSIVSDTLARSGAEVDFIHAGSRFFGKQRALRQVLRDQNIPRDRTLYIGDELRDLEACKKAGLDMLAVGWGFNPPEVLRAAGVPVVSTPQEVPAMLAGVN